ncbi:hypothetical protein ACFYT3_08180 [Nocardia amikacinitolerans]
MWYLEAFDKKSELLVRDHALAGLSTAALQRILGFGDSFEDEGVTYPPEARGYDVPLSVLPELAGYIVGGFMIDDSCDYQVGFYRD